MLCSVVCFFWCVFFVFVFFVVVFFFKATLVLFIFYLFIIILIRGSNLLGQGRFIILPQSFGKIPHGKNKYGLYLGGAVLAVPFRTM